MHLTICWIVVVGFRCQCSGKAGENSRIQLVADVIDSARAQGDWWFASGHEMANWWLSRWESSVGVNDIGEGRLQVSVTADEALGLNGAWLEVFLPGLPEDWIPRQSGALMRHVRTEWGVRIPLADIAPGEESLLDLTYLEPQPNTESQNH